MQIDNVAGRALTGAAAGLAGTIVMHPLMQATSSKFPGSAAPIRQHPGEFMVEQAHRALPDEIRGRVPEVVKKTAAQSLGLGYGMTFGALYGLVRRRGGNTLVDGAALGLVSWAVGYLGWLPATKLMPPVHKQRPQQVIMPILQHVAFGIVAVAAVQAVRAVAKD
jgi:hypothetical protein